MSPSRRALLRRLRLLLTAGFASVVIALGVLAGLTQLAMPWLSKHPERVERWLSERLERPVRIAAVDGSWRGGGPRLRLRQVAIGGGSGLPSLQVPQAELVFDLFAALRRAGALSELRISGVDLRLERDADGWRLHGFGLDALLAESSEPISLGALGAVELSDLRLAIDDPEQGIDAQWQLPLLRILNRGPQLRVLGRALNSAVADSALEFVADIEPAKRSLRAWLGGRELDFAGLLPAREIHGLRFARGRGAIDAWLAVEAGRLNDARARIRLDDLQLAAAGLAEEAGRDVEFGHLQGTARWLRTETGWSFDLADFAVGAPGEVGEAGGRLHLEQRGSGATPRWRASALLLPLGPTAELVALLPSLPLGLRRWLYRARPQGTLARAALAWDGPQRHALEASLRGFGVTSIDAFPGVERLDFELRGDAEALLLELPEQPLQVDYPQVFRRPFRFSRIVGDLVAWRSEGGWRIASDRVDFVGEGYAGQLRGGVSVPAAGLPALDLFARIGAGEVPAAKLFWPINVMPPDAVTWLDRGLVDGRIVGARAAFRGDLAHWPFHDRSGRFIARARVADARLDFDPDWPVAEDLSAVATFVNDGMEVSADAGRTLGVQANSALARIPDLDEPVLSLTASGGGTGTRLFDYLRATPIGARYREELKDVGVSGRGRVDFSMRLPLDDPDQLELDGRVELQAARLDHKAWDLHFSDASARVHFDQDGVKVDPFEVSFRERKAQFGLAIGSAVADPENVLEASLRGSYPAATVFAGVPLLDPLLADFPGVAEWNAKLRVAAGSATAQLEVESNLEGIAIQLPAPLGKPAAVALPLRLSLPMPGLGQRFDLQLAGLLAGSGRVPAPGVPLALRLDFGSERAAPPPPSGLVVRGSLDRLDVDGWLARLEGAGRDELPANIDVRARQFDLAGRHFDDQGLAVDSQAQRTQVRLTGDLLQGEIDLLRDAQGALAVTARFARLHFPEPVGEPGKVADALAGTAPSLLPPLAVRIDDFHLGQMNFGSADLVSKPIPGGMRIEQFETRSPNLGMSASGEWTGTAGATRSRFDIALSAADFGDMLAALGFPGLMEGGAAKLKIEASWPGPPSLFALSRLDGKLSVQVGSGRILDMQPGAGRLLGLLSVAEIPRRLSLDFSDLFKSGFAYNSIVGSFQLADGDADTEGLRISGPAADIVVSGRTGLRARDYDQRFQVTPHASATLPVVGALAAGPAGAVAGLVAQGLLDRPIGRAVERRYRVTGSWDKPEIVQERGADAERRGNGRQH